MPSYSHRLRSLGKPGLQTEADGLGFQVGPPGVDVSVSRPEIVMVLCPVRSDSRTHCDDTALNLFDSQCDKDYGKYRPSYRHHFPADMSSSTEFYRPFVWRDGVLEIPYTIPAVSLHNPAQLLWIVRLTKLVANVRELTSMGCPTVAKCRPLLVYSRGVAKSVDVIQSLWWKNLFNPGFRGSDKVCHLPQLFHCEAFFPSSISAGRADMYMGSTSVICLDV